MIESTNTSSGNLLAYFRLGWPTARPKRACPRVLGGAVLGPAGRLKLCREQPTATVGGTRVPLRRRIGSRRIQELPAASNEASSGSGPGSS